MLFCHNKGLIFHYKDSKFLPKHQGNAHNNNVKKDKKKNSRDSFHTKDMYFLGTGTQWPLLAWQWIPNLPGELFSHNALHFCLLLGLREVEHYNQKYMDVKFAFFYLPLLENDQTSSTDFFFFNYTRDNNTNWTVCWET